MTHQDDKQKNVKTPRSQYFPMATTSTTVGLYDGAVSFYSTISLSGRSSSYLRSHAIFFFVFNFEGVSLIVPFLLYEKYHRHWSNCISNARKRGLVKSGMKIFIICAYIYSSDEVKLKISI